MVIRPPLINLLGIYWWRLAIGGLRWLVKSYLLMLGNDIVGYGNCSACNFVTLFYC